MPELTKSKADEYVYASTVYGGLQIALTDYCTRVIKKRVTIFSAKREIMFRNTTLCKKLGAKIVEIDFGMLSNVTSKAREYCRRTGAYLIEFGGDNARTRALLTTRVRQAIKQLGHEPYEIWCVIGSGMLLECILSATTTAKIVGVKVSTSGFKITHRRISVLTYPKPFSFESRFDAGFPSMPNYDLKAFEMCVRFHKSNDVMFWNVCS